MRGSLARGERGAAHRKDSGSGTIAKAARDTLEPWSFALCKHPWCMGCTQLSQGPGSPLLPPGLSGPTPAVTGAVGLPQSNEHF